MAANYDDDDSFSVLLSLSWFAAFLMPLIRCIRNSVVAVGPIVPLIGSLELANYVWRACHCSITCKIDDTPFMRLFHWIRPSAVFVGPIGSIGGDKVYRSWAVANSLVGSNELCSSLPLLKNI